MVRWESSPTLEYAWRRHGMMSESFRKVIDLTRQTGAAAF